MGIRQLPSGRYRLQIRRADLSVDEVYETEDDATAAWTRHVQPDRSGKRSRKSGELTLDAAWTAYRDSRAFIEKKPKTQRSEDTHVKPVLVRLGTKPVKSLTADDVDKLIVAQTRAGKAPDTVRNAVAALSSVLNYCRSKSILTANVTIGVKRPSALPTVKRMPPGHQGALMKALNHPKYRYRAVARLALLVRETGARPGEWAGARWDGVHMDKRRVIFEDTKYKRQPRTVPITQASMALLSAQLEDITINHFDTLAASDWVFPVVGRDGELRPIAYTGTLRDMKKDEILPKGLRAHNGRHEFISSLVESSDLDDARIMSLVGHHSPASMQIYTHARNVRFLPQLEALEESRRKERAQELSKALGVPVKLVDAYLDHLRKEEQAMSLDDSGGELLYEAQTVEKLSAVAKRLGSTESERMRKLLEIRSKSLQRTTAEDHRRRPKG
ncbi:MAG: tyrosine-type recombinase/integrase [Burkholderiales bacterium]